MELTRKLQEIIDAISRERETLLREVEGLSEAQLEYKTADDRWAISDLMHHLALSDEANVKLFAIMASQAREKDIPKDTAPDASALGCIDHIKEMAGNRPARAPDRVAPRTHLPVEESLARLAGARQKLIEKVGELSGYDLTQLSFPHPFFKDLDGYQWLLLAGWHEARHTAQIGRIKSHEGFPAS